MPANDYFFISNWRVHGSPQEVFDIIRDAASLPRWWPAAFIDSQPASFSDGSDATRLATKGWMPYTLHWNVRTASEDPPRTLLTEVEGDFNGSGLWTFTPDGDWTDVRFEWRIRVDKPGVKQLSFLLKPLFGSNHRWAMRKGEESLRLELARRRAQSDEQRGAIAEAPGPTKTPVLPIVAGVAMFGFVMRLKRRHRSKAKQKVDEAHGRAADALEHGTDRAHHAVDRGAGVAQEIIAAVADTTRSAVEHSADLAHHAVETASTQAQARLDKSHDRSRKALDKAEAGIRKAQEKVEKARRKVAAGR